MHQRIWFGLWLVIMPLALLGSAHAAPTPTVTPDILPEPPTLVAPTPLPTATQRPTATATAETNARPDPCERNNTPAQACAIGLDTVNGPFTFVPSGDQDYYQVDLGAPNGLATVVTVREAGGLDLLTTLSRSDGMPLAMISSPAMTTTLAPEISGMIRIRVENRNPELATGKSYNIEVRRVLPQVPTSIARLNQPSPTPDMLENNWNPDTAAPIGVGVVYDLNSTCPVEWPGACAGGDFDYLRVPVKQGGHYLIATFDLGPGVDTVLELFWGDATTPLTGNDDAGPLGGASVIRWVAPANGEALVRVGPRGGGVTPLVDSPEAGFYRFAVAIADSPLAQQIAQRLAEQTQRPTPTPRVDVSIRVDVEQSQPQAGSGQTGAGAS